jgi:ankyrin repeat protein
MGELFEVLVRAGADATAADRDGNTPLHHLARMRELSATVVKILVDAGAKIDCVNARGETPLCARSNRCTRDLQHSFAAC